MEYIIQYIYTSTRYVHTIQNCDFLKHKKFETAYLKFNSD